jgi:hypothetical protein
MGIVANHPLDRAARLGKVGERPAQALADAGVAHRPLTFVSSRRSCVHQPSRITFMQQELPGKLIRQEPDRVLAAWCSEARARESEHLQASAYYENQHRKLRVAAFITSTVVGTSLLASLKIKGVDVSIVLGLLSLGSALLSGLPNTLRSAELAAEHQKASVRFGGLRREIQELRAVGLKQSHSLAETFSDFRSRFDLAVHESPTLRKSAIRYIARRGDDATRRYPDTSAPSSSPPDTA